MLISIITPLHKFDYFREQFKNIQAQTYANWEWIVVPNGPVENTRHLDCADPRVKCFPYLTFDRLPTIGALKAFATRRASGAWVVELDYDDLLEPNCLAEIAAAATNAPDADLIWSNCCQLEENGYSRQLGEPFQNREVYSEALNRSVNEIVWPKLNACRLANFQLQPNHVRAWKKISYDLLGGHKIDAPAADDYWMHTRWYANRMKFYHIDRMLYIQRMHSNNTQYAQFETIKTEAALAVKENYYRMRESDQNQLRFHLLGLPYNPISRLSNTDAFAIKVLNLASMLTNLGHTVYCYCAADSKVTCAEMVECISLEQFNEIYPVDRVSSACLDPRGWEIFNRRAIEELGKRKKPGDIILNSFGWSHRPISQAHSELPTVELGIGHPGSCSDHFRIFESYAWMHYTYGKENRLHPNWYDAVIPNYYNLNDFPYFNKPSEPEYLCFIGRLNDDKGYKIAIDVAKHLNMKIKVAGQKQNAGPFPELEQPHVEYVGTVSIEDRARLMGGALAGFTPTYYIEPFGSVAIEYMLYGTPVISTDMGSFTEINIHGKTGYRCKHLADFITAVQQIKNGSISREAVRQYATKNFNMDHVAQVYHRYFCRIHELYSGSGWTDSAAVLPLELSTRPLDL